jgi:putative chitinase
MNLSAHFTMEEATFSDYAARNNVDNSPNQEQLAHIQTTALRMELVRSLLGKAIDVSSWLRVTQVNKAIGGSSTSDHVNGYAIDFKCPSFGTPYDIALFLSKHKAELEYDQLIHEYGQWVHISFSPKKRMQDLTVFIPGKYVAGINKQNT